MFLKLGSTDIVNDLAHSFMLFHMSSSRIDKTNKQTKKIDTVKTSDSIKTSVCINRPCHTHNHFNDHEILTRNGYMAKYDLAHLSVLSHIVTFKGP